MLKKWVLLVFVLMLMSGQSVGARELESEPGAERENQSPTSLYGYGEMHFNSPKGGEREIDFHRFVIGIAHQFNSWISLHSEVDFEHGFIEPYIEYAYLDFMLNPAINLRAGSVLVPMGFTNEFHEPTTFFSVERPLVDSRIIPTTWPEGGVGIFGTPIPGLRYRLYLISGLDATAGFDGATGFSAGSGLRGGRHKVAEAPAEDLGVTGRIEYTGLPGVRLGASAYRAGADQGKIPDAKVVVTMWDVDAQLRFAGFDIQGIYVKTTIDDVAAVNAANGFTGNQSIGEEMFGWYLTLGYHLAAMMPEGHDLVPFIRYEQLNTQEQVPSGFASNPANEQEVMTTGLAYYPDERVVVKADYQIIDREEGETTRQYNLGIGWMF